MSAPGHTDSLLHRLIAPPARPLRRLLAHYLPLATAAAHKALPPESVLDGVLAGGAPYVVGAALN